MRYVIILLLLIIGAFWLGSYAFEHSVDVYVKWGDWGSITLTSTTVMIATVLGFLALYLLITVLKTLFGLPNRIRSYKQKKSYLKAKQELTKGLVHFTEGHWGQAEKMLLDNVEYSETPLLNYLAAARSAHMQEAYGRRDTYLKIASEQGEDAQIAVSVSQAEMQTTSGQLEQARATLIHLLETSPKHPYANKLLAKIYYKQEDWSNLFSLLPELNKQSLIKSTDRQKYETTALTGIFLTLAHKKDVQQLQGLWKRLPVDIRKKPQAILLYCRALSDAGGEAISDKLLISSLNKDWDEKLVERYGLIEHDNIGSTIKQAEKWLVGNETSPMLLLALARLHRKYQLWGKSKVYYNSSLNFSPSGAVYLELAELLDELDETDNAQTCYKLGLEYSIHKKGQILNLKQLRDVDSSLAIVPDIDEDIYSM